MSLKNIKLQYQQQLQLRRKYACPALCLFVLSIGLLVLFPALQVKPWLFVIIGFAVISFLLGAFGLNYWSRCPACNKVPRNYDGSISFSGFDECPKCGVELT